MPDIRHLIDLLNSPITAHSSLLLELANDPAQTSVPVRGVLNGNDLAKLLPAIQNVPMFNSGLSKIEQGKIDDLSHDETIELSRAFISLVQISSQQKMKVVQRMQTVAQMPQTVVQPPAAAS